MMNYTKSAKQLAVDMLNKRLNTQFRVIDIDVVDVHKVPGNFNTRATIVPMSGSLFQNKATIDYNRLDIGKLFHGIDVEIEYNYQTCLSDLLPSINANYGFALTANDIVDGIFDNKIKPPFRVVLAISDTNPAFTGEVIVTVTNTSKDIAKIFADVTKFEGIPYPNDDTDKIQGTYYFYTEDWTPLYPIFSRLNQGDVVSTTLGDDFDKQILTVFNKVKRDTWCNVPNYTEYNLYNSKVIYNGKVDEHNPYTTRRDVDYVLVLSIDDLYCRNVSGHLVFHYNAKAKLPI